MVRRRRRRRRPERRRGRGRSLAGGVRRHRCSSRRGSSPARLAERPTATRTVYSQQRRPYSRVRERDTTRAARASLVVGARHGARGRVAFSRCRCVRPATADAPGRSMADGDGFRSFRLLAHAARSHVRFRISHVCLRTVSPIRSDPPEFRSFGATCTSRSALAAARPGNTHTSRVSGSRVSPQRRCARHLTNDTRIAHT